MTAATFARSLWAAGAIVAMLGLASSVAAGAPADEAQPGAQAASKQTIAKAGKPVRARAVRRSVEGGGLMQLPSPITIGATTYYWYRPMIAPGRSGQRRQVYIISAEPPPMRQGWQCCLILGIAY